MSPVRCMASRKPLNRSTRTLSIGPPLGAGDHNNQCSTNHPTMMAVITAPAVTNSRRSWASVSLNAHSD
jgi:hypothetical protein